MYILCITEWGQKLLGTATKVFSRLSQILVSLDAQSMYDYLVQDETMVYIAPQIIYDYCQNL